MKAAAALFILGVTVCVANFVYTNDDEDKICRCSKACLKRFEGDCFLQKPWDDRHDIQVDMDSRTGLHTFRNEPPKGYEQIISHHGLEIDGAPDFASVDCYHSHEVAKDNTARSGTLRVGIHMIPHPDKVEKLGEDAYFVDIDRHVVGISDGVGSWARRGIDAGLYSKKLMEEAKRAVAENNDLDVLNILDTAYQRMGVIQGSATACIVKIQDGELDALNVGDSGFMVIREGNTVFRTKEQQHRFNMPFQLGGGMFGDAPIYGTRIHFSLQEGDLIILGTDGLFDNLFDKDIEALVKELGAASPGSLTAIARALALHAQDVALTAKGRVPETPFSNHAREAGISWEGGKLDDITVVVAMVDNGPHLDPRTHVGL